MVCKVSTHKKKNLVIRSDRFHLHHFSMRYIIQISFSVPVDLKGWQFSVCLTHMKYRWIFWREKKKEKVEPTPLNLGIKIIGVFLSKFLCISSCQ